MPLNKAQKQKIVEDLEEKIERQKITIFVSIAGLKVKDLFDLRKKLKKADSNLTVAKKTLMKIALEKKGIKLDFSKMEGEVAMVFGFQDEISPAKIIYQFSQENKKLEILGGYIETEKHEFLASEQIINLAKLPTRKEIEGQLTRSIFSPVFNFVNVLQAPLEACIFAIRAIGEVETNK